MGGRSSDISNVSGFSALLELESFETSETFFLEIFFVMVPSLGNKKPTWVSVLGARDNW